MSKIQKRFNYAMDEVSDMNTPPSDQSDLKNENAVKTLDELAEEFNDKWHNDYPEGMTVASYCNSEMPETCYRYGFEKGQEVIEARTLEYGKKCEAEVAELQNIFFKQIEAMGYSIDKNNKLTAEIESLKADNITLNHCINVLHLALIQIEDLPPINERDRRTIAREALKDFETLNSGHALRSSKPSED